MGVPTRRTSLDSNRAHAASGTPAKIVGLDAGVITTGATADLINCESRTFDKVPFHPQSHRIVLRGG